jgi:secreted Zn-dependent insulinase-like peptidase
MDQVISKVFDTIDKMSGNTFYDYQQILKKRLQQPFDNLKEKSEAAWWEVYEGSLDFDFHENLTEAIGELTLDELKVFFTKYFIGGPKKLSIRLYGKSKLITEIVPKEENYGYLNTKLKSKIFTKTDFMQGLGTVHK